VKLLLDTHAYLWWGLEPARLPPRATQALLDIENEVFVSVASLWEIAIKVQLAKLALPVPLDEYTATLREQSSIRLMRIEENHVYAHKHLAQAHRDPFDRMLVAQATVENCLLVTRDPQIQEYGIPTLW
jgi:PIN domain nuclease of toxin-antitoxin system